MKDEREVRQDGETEGAAGSGAAVGRRHRYVRPELVEFGSVNELTRGTSKGAKTDGGKKRL